MDWVELVRAVSCSGSDECQFFGDELCVGIETGGKISAQDEQACQNGGLLHCFHLLFLYRVCTYYMDRKCTDVCILGIFICADACGR